MADNNDSENIFERKDRLADAESTVGAPVNWGSSVPGDQSLEAAIAASQKPSVNQHIDGIDQAERPSGPVGLDVGTSRIVAAQNMRNHIHITEQVNAFFTIPISKFSRRILQNHEIMFFERGDQFCIVGSSADNFANTFNTSSRRPIQGGLLSPAEKDGISVVQAVVNTLIQKPKRFGETICYGIPGEPVDGQAAAGKVTYHEQVIKMFLQNLGYTPISINEGMATVLSELGQDDYTGIGISMGGGMCNVCLSYLSFPVITFSIQAAGDYIDTMTGQAVGEPATKIKFIKEEELDLSREAGDMVQTALHIYYDAVIHKLLHSLQRVLAASDKLPKIAKPIPIVLSGGTAMPKGCVNKFRKVLDTVSLPIAVSDVRLAADPLHTTARGALIMAMSESA